MRQLMLELTRRCNMSCSHCLRGKAEGLDMPDHVMLLAMEKLGPYTDSIGVGGGESTINVELLSKLRTSMLQSDYTDNWTDYDCDLWLVTNGMEFLKQDDPYDEYIDIVQVLHDLSNIIPISLAVSTDAWHDPGAKERFRHVEYLFESNERITVSEHGPRTYDVIISMGRGYGKPLDISLYDEDITEIYVSAKGDVYPSCDLSYKFMDTHNKSMLCFGNVVTDTEDQIMQRFQNFKDLILLSDDVFNSATIKVSEHCNDDIEELEELHKLKQEQCVT